MAISQEWLVRLMWNEKEVHWLDTGYNMWHWPLTSLMTLTLDVSRSNFEIAFICRIIGLIDVKWKGSELIWYWANCMTLPFDHTHDLDLGVSRSESEIALSQEWGSLLTMNEKDASRPFLTMILTCVTMVGWADVPERGRGDFRRRRAVDISSYELRKTVLTSTWLVGLSQKSLLTLISYGQLLLNNDVPLANFYY